MVQAAWTFPHPSNTCSGLLLCGALWRSLPNHRGARMSPSPSFPDSCFLSAFCCTLLASILCPYWHRFLLSISSVFKQFHRITVGSLSRYPCFVLEPPLKLFMNIPESWTQPLPWPCLREEPWGWNCCLNISFVPTWTALFSTQIYCVANVPTATC